MVKVINISKEPYYWTFDGGQYGPIMPGQIMELSDENGAHAIKRSVILDQDPDSLTPGEVMGFRVAYLDSVPRDQVREIVQYVCPMVQSGQCVSPAFKTKDALRDHMMTEHFSDGPLKQPGGASVSARK